MRLHRWMVSLHGMVVAPAGILALMFVPGIATVVSQDDRTSESAAECRRAPGSGKIRLQGLAVWKHEVLESTNRFLEIRGVQEAGVCPRPAAAIIVGGVS